ncbi:AraC family transcriptional regulator [Amycolatopsis rhabdoformis]|uniref:AraC family transcriptional regulator n=1 Tax=Amycolatopsis rhabdoformis TaxID=1448059 RepID=A0ABZ1IHU0_9PSEU|nr:AraC family transcriptional regulator [Amycolatopsis rhabdoformis]WSE33512.1 AraC family transcriptional regulator [Amycolatopsis rhabdoformis]
MSTGVGIRIDTRDPDEARFRLADTYSPHILTVDDRSGFRARHGTGGTAELGVHYLSYGTGTTLLDAVPFEDFVLVSRPVRGRFTVRAEGAERLLSPGEPVALDSHTAYHLRWQDDCTLLTLRLARKEFETAAAEISGRPAPARLRFPLGRRPSPTGLTAVDQVTRFLVRDAVPSGLLTSAPLIRGQVLRLVVAGLLEAYDVVARTDEPGSGGAVSPAAVRRAIAYLEGAAAEDIRITDIAAAARLSPRALQEAFRKHVGTTPMRYLKSVRLARAHAELRVAEEGVTVASVAYRWGFGNLGRFSAEYRREFGRSPSEVLRAAR